MREDGLRRRTKLTWVAMPLLFAVLFPGCASVSGVTPSIAKAISSEKLTFDTKVNQTSLSHADWPAFNWWRKYKDEQLNRIIADALSDSPTMHMVEARVREANALMGAVDSNREVQLSASEKNTRQRYSAHSTVPKPLAGTWNSFNDSTLNFNYEFDFWGKNEAAFEAALDRVHAAELDYQSARLVLIAAIIQKYIVLNQAFDQLDKTETLYNQKKRLLELTEQRVKNGIDSNVELTQAQTSLPTIEQSIISIREYIDLTRNQIAALRGTGPDNGTNIARPTIESTLEMEKSLPSDIPINLIGRRPDIIAMRWRIEAAKMDAKVARAQFYPNVSILAFAGYQSLGVSQLLNVGSLVAGAGPAISLPIFDGGRLRSNMSARNAAYDTSVEQYNQAVVDAVTEVINQVISIERVTAKIERQQHAISLAMRNYELSMQRYKGGVGTYLQVLISDTLLVTEQLKLIDLSAQAMLLDASLVRALGGGVI